MRRARKLGRYAVGVRIRDTHMTLAIHEGHETGPTTE